MKLIFIDYKKNQQGNPVFSLKPDTALLRNNQPFFYPDFSTDIRATLSLVLRVNRLGRSIGAQFATRYFDAIGVGMDITAHDLLQQCVANNLPTDCAKSFDYAAPVSSEFISVKDFSSINDYSLQLFCNGKEISGNQLPLFSTTPEEIIAFVSQFLTLKIGDYIFINTPLSSASLNLNDELTALLNGKEMLKVVVK